MSARKEGQFVHDDSWKACTALDESLGWMMDLSELWKKHTSKNLMAGGGAGAAALAAVSCSVWLQIAGTHPDSLELASGQVMAERPGIWGIVSARRQSRVLFGWVTCLPVLDPSDAAGVRR